MILETVAHHSVKVAGAQCPISKPAVTSQYGKGKHKATSPLGHVDEKKQHSHMVPTIIPPKILMLFSTFLKNACYWVVMHGTLQGTSSIHGLKRMAIPLKLQNILS